MGLGGKFKVYGIMDASTCFGSRDSFSISASATYSDSGTAVVTTLGARDNERIVPHPIVPAAAPQNESLIISGNAA